MLRILVDTCVWLHLVKDYRNLPVISAMEDLVHGGEVDLMVPQVVLDEFEGNKDRVAADAKRSLRSNFTLVRDAVLRFGDEATADDTVRAPQEADHTATYKGEAVNGSIRAVEALLRSGRSLPATDEIKARAADRTMNATAPFHRAKNSIGDAVIIETYADQMWREKRPDVEFAFVTHNKGDFSSGGGDHRQPHADLLPLFDGKRSRYWMSLADLINDLDIDLLANYDPELYGALQAHGLSEIHEAEHLLCRQVWYNRHQNLRINIERGRETVVTDAEWNAAKPKQRQRMTTEGTWKGAQEAARRTEQEGSENIHGQRYLSFSNASRSA